MKVLVIGGVAAGTKAAAKIKRLDRSAEVEILTKGSQISYAGCGLPYYVGGAIQREEALVVNTPEKFAALTGVRVTTGCEVTGVDFAAKTVTANKAGRTETYSYDKLIIAVGADPFVPAMQGTDLTGVFTMRTPTDAVGLREYINEYHPRNAVVAGAGFIGLEIAENLRAQGLSVTVVEAADQILPGVLDPEMAAFAARRLRKAGIRLMTSTPLGGLTGEGRVSGALAGAVSLPADLVVLSIGIRPSTGFLADSGLEMFKGTIVVDEQMRTNQPDVWAAGDCAMVRNRITGKPQWSPMGSTANLSGRVLALALTGSDARYPGCMGTGVVRLLDNLNAGRTGLTEAQAKAEGYDPICVVCVTDDKAHYYPGAGEFITKLVAERDTGRLLGIQLLGAGEVDKMVDIAVVGIAQRMTMQDFASMDFAYAPPFSTAIHPLVQACHILENKRNGVLVSMSPAEYAAGAADGWKVIDAQPVASIPGAMGVDLTAVNGPLAGIAPDEKLLLVCARGKRAYFLQNRLRHFGYTNTRVLEGGVTVNEVKVSFAGAIPPEEVKRVKALGCLQDKRQPDHFNVRVITRNGKITSEEQRAIAEAAEQFGSGEVTMTTRLTLEIQGVPHSQLDPLMAYLAERGLETGGTGSKVRPVVSCKGTTCQYGLCDTFALSQKLHELFYVGYHDVSLPHKFKLAVGGCPNNCVKPNLNDLGIIGQRIPEPELDKCRGCKVCQIEKACPIGAAKLVDGKLAIDPNLCNHCGRCVSKCPFKAVENSTYGYKVTIGGRWGKKIAEGRPLSKIFTSEEELLELVEKTILFFRDEGISGERFADTIARLGFDYVEDKLLNGKLDKSAVLDKVVEGGATC